MSEEAEGEKYMEKSVYDKDSNEVVDDVEEIDGGTW